MTGKDTQEHNINKTQESPMQKEKYKLQDKIKLLCEKLKSSINKGEVITKTEKKEENEQNEQIKPWFNAEACAANFDHMKDFFQNYPWAKKNPDGSITVIHDWCIKLSWTWWFLQGIPMTSLEVYQKMKNWVTGSEKMTSDGLFTIPMKTTFKQNNDGSFTITEVPQNPNRTDPGMHFVATFKKNSNGDISVRSTSGTTQNDALVWPKEVDATYSSTGTLKTYSVKDKTFQINATMDNNGNIIAKWKKLDPFSKEWEILNYTRDNQWNFTENRHREKSKSVNFSNN